MAIKRKFGWVADTEDPRDFKLQLPPRLLQQLPVSSNLRWKLPSAFDQGNLGSCTAHATLATMLSTRSALSNTRWPSYSRLFLYYETRRLEGTLNEDSGAQLRNAFKAAANVGVCKEESWPYIESKFASAPPQELYTDDLTDRLLTYQRSPQDERSLKAALAAGHVVAFGFTAYESFVSNAVAQSGVLPMPKQTEPVLGGHAVVLVGHDDLQRRFLVRNSWGPNWGPMNGHFWMPYAYVTNPLLARDFWTAQTME